MHALVFANTIRLLHLHLLNNFLKNKHPDKVGHQFGEDWGFGCLGFDDQEP
jgi:hypothetical protein